VLSNGKSPFVPQNLLYLYVHELAWYLYYDKKVCHPCMAQRSCPCYATQHHKLLERAIYLCHHSEIFGNSMFSDDWWVSWNGFPSLHKYYTSVLPGLSCLAYCKEFSCSVFRRRNRHFLALWLFKKKLYSMCFLLVFYIHNTLWSFPSYE
jgi:hypothetical protein